MTAEDKGLSKSPRAEREEKILSFWEENKIFEKTLEKESPKGDFVFYEGPPTANGRPGIHHLEARAFKDAIPRYKTMQGYRVPRKAGWDTHGLPVELEVEKKLGLQSKKEIEAYGVDKFNEECRKSVWQYQEEWQRFTNRMGYWVDLDRPYITYDNAFMQSIWSILAEVDGKGLIYKDYKVVPWCPRCGTGLSSHELAQGYKDVKDLSIYAKFRVVGEENTYILAWTTTPWTLPGNIALAVGEDIDYVKVSKDGETLIMAESRLSVLDGDADVIERMKGKNMVGLKYEPLYPFIKDNYQGENLEKAYQVYAASFVTTEDGTGVVHTAVMYGQDDFELGNKIGLPKYHLVDESGHFKREAGFLAAKFVKDEETAVDIIKDLAHRGLLYKKEKYEHSYPHCWRCKTPLIYYARDSWYIRMSSLRDELVKENDKINWEPEYIKEGRFGEWLREVKDWAISRERYWGTPLPIWMNDDGEKLVISSVDDIRKYGKKSGNKYFVMRHGGTEGNRNEVVSYSKEAEDNLTGEGKEQVRHTAENLKEKKIDLIVSSPFTRTRETAHIVADILGIENIVFDERLKEIDPGSFDGGDWFEYHKEKSQTKDWFKDNVGGGESYENVLKRSGEALYDLEREHRGKNILIITHGSPAWLLSVAAGYFEPTNDEYVEPTNPVDTEIFVPKFKRFQNAEVRELDFVPMPHDNNYRVDLHKPYIDEIVLEKDGKEYRRVKEVMDVWFDSGSVPFSQDATDREKPGDFSKITYPADFISEGLDQTRGWFYTMHAIGTLMGKGRAFENVICLGLILDKEGKKMSKSVGNVVNPWEMIDEYGVDALRLWMYSVNQPGESKNFDPRTVDEINKRIFNLIDNVYSFYELYRDRELEVREFKLENPNVLDSWILLRLSDLTDKMTEKMDAYKLLEPVRDLRDFVDDLSTWYLRRSRDRIKDGDIDAKRTLYFVLKRISKLLAPFAPFAAEDLYQKLRSENSPISVHLCDWPEKDAVRANPDVIEKMIVVRNIVSAGLEARSRSNIKIRQPLNELRIGEYDLGEDYLELIKEEVNVKKVNVDKNLLEGTVALDTLITPELEEEGRLRDEIRALQDLRKEKGLQPGDLLNIEVPSDKRELYEKFSAEIKRITNVEF